MNNTLKQQIISLMNAVTTLQYLKKTKGTTKDSNGTETGIILTKGVILDGYIEPEGIAVRKGIERLAAMLSSEIQFKIEKIDCYYVIIKQFYYNGICFYESVYSDINSKESIIYDNTTDNSGTED